jgi:hypothetical protein
MEILRKQEGKIGKKMNWGSKRWLPSSHLLGYIGGNRKFKIPLLANQGYMPLEGEIENLSHRSIGRMPDDRNLLSLDASLAILTRVLRFEVSGLRRRTPVKPIWSCCISVFGSSVLALWINQRTQWFFGEPLETP